MKLFKNKNWTKRDYEATNVVYQITDKTPIDFNGQDNDNWVEVEISADDQELIDHDLMEITDLIKGFTNIGRLDGRTFYGHM